MNANSSGYVDMAFSCLRDAQEEFAKEFELDAKTNLYAKRLPEWAMRIHCLIHAAGDHLINAAESFDERYDAEGNPLPHGRCDDCGEPDSADHICK